MEKVNRRRFLKVTGVGGLTLALGGLGWRIGAVWWDQPSAEGYRVLSAREVQISDAIAEAIFPGEPEVTGAEGAIPDGAQAGVTRFLDRALDELFEELTGNAMRMLLHAIDDLAVGADWRLARFHVRPLEQRVAILEGWEGSSSAARRGVFSALKMFMSMGYCESPEVLAAVGISYTCGGTT